MHRSVSVRDVEGSNRSVVRLHADRRLWVDPVRLQRRRVFAGKPILTSHHDDAPVRAALILRHAMRHSEGVSGTWIRCWCWWYTEYTSFVFIFPVLWFACIQKESRSVPACQGQTENLDVRTRGGCSGETRTEASLGVSSGSRRRSGCRCRCGYTHGGRLVIQPHTPSLAHTRPHSRPGIRRRAR